MHRLCVPGIILLFVLFFASCGVPDVLFLADEAWITLNGTSKDLEKQFRLKGYNTAVEVISIGEPEENILDTLDTSGRTMVVLSPLLSGYAGKLADTYPERVFIACGPWERENIIPIVTDRKDALIEAGRRCAEWVGSREGDATTAAAVFLSGSDSREEEYEVFMEGWKSSGYPASIEVKRISPDSGAEELDTFLSLNLLERTILGIFFAGIFNKQCIEYCSDLSIPVVTEHIPPDGGSEHGILFQVKHSYMNAVYEALQVAGSTEGGRRAVFMKALLEEGDFSRNR